MRGGPPMNGARERERSLSAIAQVAASEGPCARRGLRRPLAIIARRVRPSVAIDVRFHVRPSRRALLAIAGIAAAVAVALSLYEVAPEIAKRKPLAAPELAKELVALVRPGPVVYFPGPDGSIQGLDADLLRLYAAERKLTLRFVAIDNVADLLAALGSGDAHLGAGGLLRSATDGHRDAPVPAAAPEGPTNPDAPSPATI